MLCANGDNKQALCESPTRGHAYPRDNAQVLTADRLSSRGSTKVSRLREPAPAEQYSAIQSWVEHSMAYRKIEMQGA